MFWSIAAHFYSAKSVGLAAAVISAMLVTSLVCTVGADAVVIAVLPSRTDHVEWSLTLNAALLAAGCTSLLGGALVAALLPNLGHDFTTLSTWYALLFVVGTVTWTISTVLDYAFIAERRARFMFFRNGLMSLGKFALLIVFGVAAGATSAAIVVPWVVASVVSVGIAFAMMIPRLGRGYTIAYKGVVAHIRQLLRSLAGNHIINLSGALPPLLLPVLVATRLSSTSNAYFYATWMVGSVFFVVSPAVSSALFAEGSYARNALASRTRSAARLICALLVPIALGYLLFGRLVLSLFGPAYARQGWSVLLVLLVSAVPDAITNIYVAVMRVSGRLRSAALLNIGIAAVAIGLAWILLPGLGIKGAAVAWLIAQVAGSVAVAVHAVAARLRTGWLALGP